MLHHKLRELRVFNGLTQSEMAKVLNITREAYSMYESNKRQMNHESLCLLADYFEVTTDYLLGRKDQDMILLKKSEKDIIKKYRELDKRGSENVIGILDMEYSRLDPKKNTDEKAM